jgi:hypothetical protein
MVDMGSEGCFIFGTVILFLKLAIEPLAYMDASWNAYGKMSLRGLLASAHIRPGKV